MGGFLRKPSSLNEIEQQNKLSVISTPISFPIRQNFMLSRNVPWLKNLPPYLEIRMLDFFQVSLSRSDDNISTIMMPERLVPPPFLCERDESFHHFDVRQTCSSIVFKPNQPEFCSSIILYDHLLQHTFLTLKVNMGKDTHMVANNRFSFLLWDILENVKMKQFWSVMQGCRTGFQSN